MKAEEILPRVEEKRKRDKISQSELARQIGVSRQTYNTWINGISEPSEQSLRKLYNFLHENKTSKPTIVIEKDDKMELFKSSQDVEGTVTAMEKAGTIED